MKILAFDTSSNTTSVAIAEGQNILAYLEDLNIAKQAECLIPMIEQALKFTALTYSAIDCLGVITGPGSFTGIRVGLAAAKGILLATNIKSQAVTNFEIINYQVRQQIKNYCKVIVLLNAHRNQLYSQIFDQQGNITGPAKLIDISKITDLFDGLGGQIVCAGSGLEFVYEQLKSRPNTVILPIMPKRQALHICSYIANTITLVSLQKLSPQKLAPLYIRS